MRKDFLILIPTIILSQLFFSCSQTPKPTPDYVVVAGEITNPTGDSVWVRLAKALGPDVKISGDALDENNRFTMRVPLTNPAEASFFDGNETKQLFLEPGDSIYLTLNTDEFDETVLFSGIGAPRNDFIAKNYLKFQDIYWEKFAPRLEAMNGDDAIAVIDSLQLAQNKYFQEFLKSNNVSSEFEKWQQSEITFSYPSQVFSYLMSKYSANNYQLDTINIGKQVYNDFLDFLSSPDSCKLSSRFNDYFYNAMIIIDLKNLDKNRMLKNRDSIFFALADQNFSGYGKELVVAERFYDRIRDYNPEYLDNNRGQFDKFVKNTELRELVLEPYEINKKLLESQMPQGANILDLDDPGLESISYSSIIEKYRGKLIYLDFWASWCGPCKSEMPSSLKLQEEFKGRDVAFVYFSVDKDSTKWSAMIKILQISGDHYRLNKKVKDETNKLFDVKFIPRYILIDKQGKVISDDAKRPSDPEIIDDIEKSL